MREVSFNTEGGSTPATLPALLRRLHRTASGIITRGQWQRHADLLRNIIVSALGHRIGVHCAAQANTQQAACPSATLWRPVRADGESFFVDGDDDLFVIGPPQLGGALFSVSRDAQRFLVVPPTIQRADSLLHLLVNWPTALEARR